MIRIAQEKKLIEIKAHDLREFAVNEYGQVDDRPYGGGPGQVLMVEPVYRALKQIAKETAKRSSKILGRLPRPRASGSQSPHLKTILLSARGKKWNQQMAQKFSKLDQIIFVCPRYEGHDERIRKFVDEEISIGDYVLTGGELGAAVIIDSVTRLIPGVLGKAESLKTESHSMQGFREYPQYTRPETFVYETGIEAKKHRSIKAMKQRINEAIKQKNKKTKKTTITKKLRVPKVLLTGHHKNIEAWRAEHSRNAD